MARVESFLNAGATKYSYVERFFFWSERSPSQFHEQVAFFQPHSRRPEAARGDHDPEGSFFADPVLGQRIFKVAREIAEQRRSFAVLEAELEGRPYQIILHFLWDDGTRSEAFAIIGFLVNLEAVRERLFQQLAKTELLDVLNPRSDSPRLGLAVLDEKGQRVHGSTPAKGLPAAFADVGVLFFPAEALRNWLAGDPATTHWRLVVSVVEPIEPKREGGWLFGAVVILLIIALFCAVTVDRQALRLSAMQADFVANVSHHLKTPLFLLTTAAETLGLARVRSPEKLREYAEIVRSQTDRLSGLVDQILQFSRLEGSSQPFELEQLDLNVFAQEVISDFSRCVERADVSIRFEGTGNPILIRADANALEQAITNLLANAIKYSNGHNDVVCQVAVDGKTAVLRIRDRGVGIDPSDVPHIFEKFYRGRNNGHPRGGFGLGLAIVYAVAKGHGGRVAVKSAKGQGSEFAVFLPIV
jgi:signal transduction histidine kinase